MGRGSRRWWRRSEHGWLLPAWGLAAGAGVVAVVAAIIVTVIVVGSQPPTIGFSVSASASRNSSQDIAVVIPWSLHYPSVAYAAALSTYPTLSCAISQVQFDRTRTFSTSDSAGGSDQDVRGSLTLNVTGDDHSIQGDFSLRCELDKDGKQLATAYSSVTIPPYGSPSPSEASSPSPSDTPTDTPAAAIDGVYNIQWGQAINGCAPTGGLVPTLTLTSDGAGPGITISIGGNTMTGTLDSNSNFQVKSQDNTAKMIASLVQTQSPVRIANGQYQTYTDQTGDCAYEFTATHT